MPRLPLVAGALVLTISCGSKQPSNAAPGMALAPSEPASRPPPPTAADTGLTETQIRSVVESEYARVRGCHTIEFSGHPDSGGKIVVELTVSTDGVVSGAKISESSFDSQQLHDCVMEVTRSLAFPRTKSETEFSWVYRFRE